MSKKILSSLFLAAIIIESFAQPTISLQQVASGFSSPVDIAHAGDGSNRLFIVEQNGIIKIIDNGSVLNTPFLNITSKVINSGERGLLGLAFHPDYETNGYFYVNYTAANLNGDTRISRFSVSSNDPNVADPNSESVLLEIDQPFSNHNAGDLAFGPDGFLYIPLGDGGSGGDPGNRAQNTKLLLGKMLRLDVDTSAGYKIPSDNPFVGDTSVDDRIWAIGLRNPWRFSFDRLTGDMWIGDVGQNAWEEIDFQPANSTGGENYGWRCYEGNNAYNTNGCGSAGNYVFPVFDYDNNALGCSVTGGYVYRGCQYPELYGHYVFADYCSGRFWTIYQDQPGNFNTVFKENLSNFQYSSFGEDEAGELYVAGLGNGIIYQIQEATPATAPSVIANGDTVFCPGDSVILTTANVYDSYYWTLNDSIQAENSNSIAAKSSGSYIVTGVAENGCEYSSAPQALTHLAAPNPIITALANEFCEGDSLLLSTGSFVDYLWPNGANLSSTYIHDSGNFSVTVTGNNGCTGSSEPFTVTRLINPNPIIIQQDSTLSTSEQAVYQWFFEGTILPADTQRSIAPSQEGNYTVAVTDSNGCTGISAPFNFMFTGISEDFVTVTALYPNPFKQQTTLTYRLEHQDYITVNLIDITGQRITLFSGQQMPGMHDLIIGNSTSPMSSGVYFLQISTSKGINTQKLIRL